jgi:hypothetical protein
MQQWNPSKKGDPQGPRSVVFDWGKCWEPYSTFCQTFGGLRGRGSFRVHPGRSARLGSGSVAIRKRTKTCHCWNVPGRSQIRGCGRDLETTNAITFKPQIPIMRMSDAMIPIFRAGVFEFSPLGWISQVAAHLCRAVRTRPCEASNIITHRADEASNSRSLWCSRLPSIAVRGVPKC